LIDFKFVHNVRAENGVPGSGRNKSGKKGSDKTLKVPPGTVVKTYPDEKLIFDFTNPGIDFIITKGGKGGLGNIHFKSSTNQAPRFAQKGKPGESITVILELKLIAFAGLVGFPNAGKSTLISKISGAKPKIADYPFTTLTPHLGVVYLGQESLVVADIPGIIEGAHNGEGMGLNFLKHIERNKVLIFLLEVSPYAPLEPLQAFHVLREELKSYNVSLMRKRHFVVANKIDLLETDLDGSGKKHLELLREYCQKEKLPFLEISAVKDINLNKFKEKLFELYHEA
ncbi:MAG: GTPase ObgE, partial [Desulfobacteraceae bacterium]